MAQYAPFSTRAAISRVAAARPPRWPRRECERPSAAAAGAVTNPGVSVMPCLLALFALIAPRLTIVLLWFFTNWFTGMFTSLLWPILGVIFLPTTLLWFSIVHNVWGGVWALPQVIGIVIALAIDVSPASGRRD
jgi:hypothetical protein